MRNVGHLMMDASVLDRDGQPVPEGILDCVVTSLIAMHDLKGNRQLSATAAPARSTSSSRRCTAPSEVAFANELFDRVEDALGLPRNT